MKINSILFIVGAMSIGAHGQSNGLRKVLEDDGELEQKNAACADIKLWDGAGCTKPLKYDVKQLVWNTKGDTNCIKQYTGWETAMNNMFCKNNVFHFTVYQNDKCKGKGQKVTMKPNECYIPSTASFLSFQAKCAKHPCPTTGEEIEKEMA